MLLAVATRERADCLGRHVGAVLVADQRIIATGYNGTPTGFPNCDEGGCHRCAHPDDYARGRGYDVCICVHAEQNAVLQAARLGYTVQSARCYTTLRPCFGCLKELYQAGVSGVRYLNQWLPSDPVEAEAYADLIAEMSARGVEVEPLDLPPSCSICARRRNSRWSRRSCAGGAGRGGRSSRTTAGRRRDDRVGHDHRLGGLDEIMRAAARSAAAAAAAPAAPQALPVGLGQDHAQMMRVQPLPPRGDVLGPAGRAAGGAGLQRPLGRVALGAVDGDPHAHPRFGRCRPGLEHRLNFCGHRTTNRMDGARVVSAPPRRGACVRAGRGAGRGLLPRRVRTSPTRCSTEARPVCAACAPRSAISTATPRC